MELVLEFTKVMAKKSFILYSDTEAIVEELSNEQAGILFKNIFKCVNEIERIEMDLATRIVFKQIAMQIDRDNEKYEVIKQKRSEAGALGGRGKAKQTKPKKANALSAKQSEANKADNVTVIDSVNDTVINKEMQFDLFWSKYPNKVAKDKCKEKFLRLSNNDVKTIISTIDSYISYKPFETYRHPNPETYLNQRRWADEKKQDDFEHGEELTPEQIEFEAKKARIRKLGGYDF
jgi:hypothetical protein